MIFVKTLLLAGLAVGLVTLDVLAWSVGAAEGGLATASICAIALLCIGAFT